MTNSSPEAAAPKLPTDVAQLHQLAGAEEALINKLDIMHTGAVTIDQLQAATHDKHLSVKEQQTAELMLRSQDDLRYQRLGYLPHMGGFADSGAPMAGDDRPSVKAHEAGKQIEELRKTIKLSDVESFDASVTRLERGRDMESRGPEQISKYIMSHYATGDKGTRLTAADVSRAIDELSQKDKSLSLFEKEELDVLKATRTQMNEMSPGAEPADHKSIAHKIWQAENKRIPATESQLSSNVAQIIDQYENNPSVGSTLMAVRYNHRDHSAAMNAAVELASPPAAATQPAPDAPAKPGHH